MRWLTFAIGGMLMLSACGPSTAASANPTAAPKPAQAAGTTAERPAAPATQPSQPAAAATAPSRAASATIDGIRVTVDGQAVDLPGDVQVSSQRAAGTAILNIGKNPRPSALVGGNGVLLEMQTAPGKDVLQDGFSAADIAVVTFTVWKGVDFSYISTGAIPGQPIKSLALSLASGKLAGSFESDLNGTLGKKHARVEFGVAMPK